MKSANPYSTIELKTDTSLLGISEQGGYVTDWEVKDSKGKWISVLYIGSELKRTGIPILFPYYGPSESGMGQHGFGRNLKWKVVSQSENEATLELTDQDLPEETKKLYPHLFKTQISLKLAEYSFEYSLKVTNLGSDPMPIAPGLHPYWAVDHNKKMNVTLENYPQFDASKIDWDTSPPDIEYQFRNPVRINFPDKTITIEDLSDKITKLVVWSQPKDAPDHDFICFEPVTRERGSYDKKPIQILPREVWQLSVNFSCSFQDPDSGSN